MLEKAVDTTRRGKSTNVQDARFADDMVILIDAERRSDWLVKAIDRRLREEFAKLRVEINEDKSRMVDLKKGESFTFLGFEYRRVLIAVRFILDCPPSSLLARVVYGVFRVSTI